jgi:hypothetical protein
MKKPEKIGSNPRHTVQGGTGDSCMLCNHPVPRTSHDKNLSPSAKPYHIAPDTLAALKLTHPHHYAVALQCIVDGLWELTNGGDRRPTLISFDGYRIGRRR